MRFSPNATEEKSSHSDFPRRQYDASDFISFILVIHRDLDVIIAQRIVYDFFLTLLQNGSILSFLLVERESSICSSSSILFSIIMPLHSVRAKEIIEGWPIKVRGLVSNGVHEKRKRIKQTTN